MGSDASPHCAGVCMVSHAMGLHAVNIWVNTSVLVAAYQAAETPKAFWWHTTKQPLAALVWWHCGAAMLMQALDWHEQFQ